MPLCEENCDLIDYDYLKEKKTILIYWNFLLFSMLLNLLLSIEYLYKNSISLSTIYYLRIYQKFLSEEYLWISSHNSILLK